MSYGGSHVSQGGGHVSYRVVMRAMGVAMWVVSHVSYGVVM